MKLEVQVIEKLDILRSWLYETNSCISSHLENTKIFHSDDCFFWLVEASQDQEKPSEKVNVLDCMYSTLTKITYILTFPSTHLEEFFRAVWDTVSLAAVLIWLQIKLNSQLSCCAFFLIDIILSSLCLSASKTRTMMAKLFELRWENQYKYYVCNKHITVLTVLVYMEI